MATKEIKPMRFEIKVFDSGTDEQMDDLFNALADAGFGIVGDGFDAHPIDAHTCGYEYCGPSDSPDMRAEAKKRALDRIVQLCA